MIFPKNLLADEFQAQGNREFRAPATSPTHASDGMTAGTFPKGRNCNSLRSIFPLGRRRYRSAHNPDRKRLPDKIRRRWRIAGRRCRSDLGGYPPERFQTDQTM